MTYRMLHSLIIRLFVLGVFFLQVHVYCYIQGCGIFDSCSFLPWLSWGSCSETCGGGIKTRRRAICCWPYERWSGTDCSFMLCGAHESNYSESTVCNEICYNSGYYYNGTCICPDGLYGKCCHELECLARDDENYIGKPSRFFDAQETMFCSFFTICQFLSWSDWSECDGQCGQTLGVRNRSRVLCCYPLVRTYGPDCRFVKCGAKEEDYHDNETCALSTCMTSLTTTKSVSAGFSTMDSRTSDSLYNYVSYAHTDNSTSNISATAVTREDSYASTQGPSNSVVTDTSEILYSEEESTFSSPSRMVPMLSDTSTQTDVTDSKLITTNEIAIGLDGFQSSYFPSNSMECNETSRMQGNLQIQNGQCLNKNEEVEVMYVNMQGQLIDIMSDEFVEALFRMPPDTMNDACKQVLNATYLVSIVYMTEVPSGSQEHEFNLGLVSTEFQILKETFCPILEGADVKLDPISVISNYSNTKTFGDRNSSGEVIVTFCVPVNDTCLATLYNDNITFSVYTTPLGGLKWNETTVSMEMNDGRVYGYYTGLLQALTLEVSCEGNSTNFTSPECYNNYGLITATTEAKTLNESNGGWEIPQDESFLGINEGQLVFRTKFFHTDGFNLYPIAPEVIEFDGIFSEENIGDSYTVLLVILILMFILIAMTAMTLKLDHSDSIREIYHRVLDSKLPCKTSYLMSVQTGFTSSSEFRSPLYLEISGIYNSSGTKLLNYSYDGMLNLRRGCTFYFYISMERDIGPISHIKLWHENKNEGILIQKIIIQDLNMRKYYTFLLDEWLSFAKGWKLHIAVKPHDDIMRDSAVLFPKLVKHKLLDDLLLLSLFIRPAYSNFTRTQRLYSLYAIAAFAMLTSAMWFTTDQEQALYGLKIGPISVNYKQIYTGVFSSIISAPPLILIVFCFRNSRTAFTPSTHFCTEDVKRQLCLPKGFRILAWILAILSILLSAFFIFLYSLQWGGTVSEDWLVSVSFGFLFNIVLGPLKITVIAAVLSGLFRRKSVSEISTLPILDISAKPKVKGFLHPSSWPGDCETREQRKREKDIKLDQKLKQKFSRLLLALLYLTMPCLMAFHNCPNTRYRQNSQLLKILQPNFKIDKARDVDSWLNGQLHPFLPRPGHHQFAPNEQCLASDGTSFIFGAIRVRQIRETERFNCIRINKYKVFSTVCPLPRKDLETNNFCAEWIHRNGSNCTEHPWFQYISEDLSTSHRTLGEFEVYHGGGYVIDINPITDNISAIANDIASLSWFDQKTRFVTVEATVTNPSTRLFSMISFKWEFSSIGAVDQEHTVRSLRFYPYIDLFDYLILVVQLLFIVFTMVELINLFIRCSNTRKLFNQKLFYLIRIVMVFLSVTIAAVYIYRIDRTIYTIQRVFNDKEQFISLDKLLMLDYLYTTCLGALIFLRMILLLSHMTYNFHIYLLKNTMTLAIGQFASCSVLLGIAIIAFGSLEYLCLGRTLADYRSVYNGLVSLVCATLSLAKLSSGKEENISYFDKLSFILFSLIVNLVLLNILISILNETFAALKSGKFVYGSIPYFDKELNKFLIRKLSQMLSFCKFNEEDKHEVPVKNPTLWWRMKRTITDFSFMVERISFEDALLK